MDAVERILSYKVTYTSVFNAFTTVIHTSCPKWTVFTSKFSFELQLGGRGWVRYEVSNKPCQCVANPHLQVHLLKLFDNVKSLSFGRGAKNVLGMGSSEGEVFQLREPVAVEGPVEVWMTEVEKEMTNSLQSITKEGVYRYANEERQEWITAVLGMVSLVGSQIWWTWEVR